MTSTTTSPTIETVTTLRTGSVSTVTINRPERLNAIDPQTHVALREHLVAADRDPQTRVIVLTGAGRAFCAGGDVKSMEGENQFANSERVHSLGRQLIDVMVRLEKPVIAKVNGAAVGLGATIALMSDIVYMAQGAQIGDRHVNVGLVAGDGGAVIWPLLIGPSRAKEMLMTGRMLSGDEASAMGLVSRVVPADELDVVVSSLAEELAAQPPYAVRATKLAVNKVLEASVAQVLDVSLAYEHLSMRTEDHQEALRAFAEGRRGVYTGR